MGKVKTDPPIEKTETNRPALSSQAREQHLINLAMNRAEEKLMDGTASQQLIIHFLRLGSIEQQKKIEGLEKEIELKDAKIKSLERSDNAEQLFADAIKAMQIYKGESKDEFYD